MSVHDIHYMHQVRYCLHNILTQPRGGRGGKASSRDPGAFCSKNPPSAETTRIQQQKWWYNGDFV